MSYTQTHILESETWPRTLTADGSGGVPLVHPTAGMVHVRDHRLQIAGRVATVSATGDWQWRIVLEVALPHTGELQGSEPAWVQVSPSDLGVITLGCAPDGDQVLIATQDTSLPHVWSLTIPEWVGQRLRMRSIITGDAALSISLTLTEWGD